MRLALYDAQRPGTRRRRVHLSPPPPRGATKRQSPSKERMADAALLAAPHIAFPLHSVGKQQYRRSALFALRRFHATRSAASVDFACYAVGASLKPQRERAQRHDGVDNLDDLVRRARASASPSQAELAPESLSAYEIASDHLCALQAFDEEAGSLALFTFDDFDAPRSRLIYTDADLFDDPYALVSLPDGRPHDEVGASPASMQASVATYYDDGGPAASEAGDDVHGDERPPMAAASPRQKEHRIVHGLPSYAWLPGSDRPLAEHGSAFDTLASSFHPAPLIAMETERPMSAAPHDAGATLRTEGGDGAEQEEQVTIAKATSGATKSTNEAAQARETKIYTYNKTVMKKAIYFGLKERGILPDCEGYNHIYQNLYDDCKTFMHRTFSQVYVTKENAQALVTLWCKFNQEDEGQVY